MDIESQMRMCRATRIHKIINGPEDWVLFAIVIENYLGHSKQMLTIKDEQSYLE